MLNGECLQVKSLPVYVWPLVISEWKKQLKQPGSSQTMILEYLLLEFYVAVIVDLSTE